MASSKSKTSCYSMHEDVGANPTVVREQCSVIAESWSYVKSSTGFSTFSPNVIVVLLSENVSPSDCYSLIFLYLQHRHVAQMVERFKKACIMGRDTDSEPLCVIKNLSLVQVQPCRIQFSKISKKQKRVHRKRGSLSAKVRMGFVYVLWQIARTDSRESGMRRR